MSRDPRAGAEADFLLTLEGAPPPEDLPFGPPPDALRPDRENAARTDAGIEDRVRSLANNAVEVASRSPMIAASCWHEAGRLLDRRLDRPDRAWICHGRALVVFPEHKPAGDALRRLARRSRDRDLLAAVLEDQIARLTDPLESAAILAEKSSSRLQEDDAPAALEALREAAQAHSGALVPRLLMLPVAVRESEEDDLAESLAAIVEHWPTRAGGAAARFLLALVEERRERADESLRHLVGVDGGEERGLGAAESWLGARLALRTGETERAVSFLDGLAEGLGEGDLAEAVRIFSALIGAILDERSTSAESASSRPEQRWEASWVGSLREPSPTAEQRAVSLVSEVFSTPRIAAAAELDAALARRVSGAGGAGLPDAAELAERGPRGRAVAALFGHPVSDPLARVESEREDAGTALFRSLAERSPRNLASALELLRGMAEEDDDRWGLAVAQAALAREDPDAAGEAVDLLRREGGDLTREPLPSLIRMHAGDAETLAALAEAEADQSQDSAGRALHLAWAAHHLSKVDAGRAEELQRLALEIDPACRPALLALERGRADHLSIGEAYAAAAQASGDEAESAGLLLRAAVHRAAASPDERVLDLLLGAQKVLRRDVELWRATLWISELFPSGIGDRFPEPSAESGDLRGDEMFALAGVIRDGRPAAATEWLERVVESLPDDPIGRAAYVDALLVSGRWSVVSGLLLAELREAESPEHEARIYVRMADVDLRFGKDASSSVLSLVSLDEVLPGNRTALAKLALFYARQGRDLDLAGVLPGLASALDDDRDAAALAATAWRIDSADPGPLRIAVERRPSCAVDLVALEGLTDDRAESERCLAQTARLLEGSGIHLSRLADRREESGDFAAALAGRREALELREESLLDREGCVRHLEALGDFEGVIATCEEMARRAAVGSHRVEKLLQAARVARDRLGDDARAAAECLAALEIDPQNEEAFRMGRALAEEVGDRGLLAGLIAARIHGIEDQRAKHRLLLELGATRLSIGERDPAKIALGLALEIAPADLETRRKLAALHREDGEWNESIEHLVQAARSTRDPRMGIEIFFDLGVLYMEHTEHLDLAEKSFVKVLGWDRGHFAAMERLAAVYARKENWGRVAQALERLVMMADSEKVKVDKMVELGRTLDARLGRAQDAERLLAEARRIAPLDAGPIEALAEIYTRQRDAMALNVLLDQSLLTQASAIAAEPGRADLYANVHRLLTMKADDRLAAIAATAVRLAGGDPSRLPEVGALEEHWDIGMRLADPAVFEFLAPKQVPSGLRETLRITDEPVAKLLGLTAKQQGLGRDARLGRNAPLSVAMGRFAEMLGLRGEPQVFVGSAGGIRVTGGPGTAVIVPAAIAESQDAAVVSFAAASAVVLAALGLGMATMLPEPRLRRLVAALVRISVPSYSSPEIEESALEAEAATLRESVSGKLLARLQPFAFECSSALEHPDLREGVLSVGRRAGFLAAGSLEGAIAGLRVEQGATSADLSRLDGAGELMEFVFSKTHQELRRRMGL
ncbi:MAG: hypothetical protein R6V85_19800 [Polyangia bacterium]